MSQPNGSSDSVEHLSLFPPPSAVCLPACSQLMETGVALALSAPKILQVQNARKDGQKTVEGSQVQTIADLQSEFKICEIPMSVTRKKRSWGNGRVSGHFSSDVSIPDILENFYCFTFTWKNGCEKIGETNKGLPVSLTSLRLQRYRQSKAGIFDLGLSCLSNPMKSVGLTTLWPWIWG